MGSIHPLAQQRIFDPDTAHAMGLAFETAWQKLLGSRSELAFSADADRTREELVMHIIDLANGGERDVTHLRDKAVAFVTRATPGRAAAGYP
jgi:hypothetical protein